MKLPRQRFYFMFFLLAMVSVSANAQLKYPFAGRANTGFIVNHTDLSSNDYLGEKPNLFVSGGLSYYLRIMDAWLCGDVMYGNVDGNNDTVFFTNSFYGGSLSLKFDIIKWFADTRFQLNPRVGLGLMIYNSKLYNTSTRNVIQESPAPQGKAFSPNPNIEFGAELAYILDETVSVEIGYTRKVMFGNDYFDAFLQDAPFETVDLFSAGLSFKFGKGSSAKRANSKKVRNTDDVVEMTNEEYSNMVFRIDSLESKLSRGNPEEKEKYIIENKKLAEEVRSLNRTIDSLQADVFEFDFTGVNDTALFDLDEGA
ncbi:MAG: hypothetical protein ACPF9D_12340, partial [Owenweeksia sp.]